MGIQQFGRMLSIYQTKENPKRKIEFCKQQRTNCVQLPSCGQFTSPVLMRRKTLLKSKNTYLRIYRFLFDSDSQICMSMPTLHMLIIIACYSTKKLQPNFGEIGNQLSSYLPKMSISWNTACREYLLSSLEDFWSEFSSEMMTTKYSILKITTIFTHTKLIFNCV